MLSYKGHSKERTLDSSYRTISTCPLVAKGLDILVRDHSIDKWISQQAATQYQGEGSTHELTSLLITELIQHFKFASRKSIFLLFLDAKSAFDTVLVPYLVRNLHQAGTDPLSLLYINNRLSNRVTYCEFNSELAGPIHDQHGLEQGGASSSDCYKLYNNEFLNQAHRSKLGVHMGGKLVVSSVGQADDVALVANVLQQLRLLLKLALDYCQKFNVQLCPSKTKLFVVQPKGSNNILIPCNPIRMGDNCVDLTSTAEHVGVIRSIEGNMPNLLKRISSFKKVWDLFFPVRGQGSRD